jgi:hypothetical protein
MEDLGRMTPASRPPTAAAAALHCAQRNKQDAIKNMVLRSIVQVSTTDFDQDDARFTSRCRRCFGMGKRPPRRWNKKTAT